MGWATARVLVRVPATSANLGPGFDALGLALTLHDATSNTMRLHVLETTETTTQAAVLSSVMIIVADAFLTKVALYLADKLF